jgi:hypothetical protein
VTDDELLEAVALHTVGKPGMSPLDHPLLRRQARARARERLDDGYRRRCLALPLDEMLLAVVEGVIGWMRAQGRAVAPETLNPIQYPRSRGRPQ